MSTSGAKKAGALAALAIGVAGAAALAWTSLRSGPASGRSATPADPGGPAEAPPGDGPRHIVLIVIDTVRGDYLSSYGFEQGTSPELDALAAEGVRFARPVAQSPWTRPSIGSFLTSRYPRDLGLYVEKGQVLADRFVTLAEVLREHGYRTLGATANPNVNSSFNFQQGFDRYVDSDVVWKWMDRQKGQVSERKSHLRSARNRFRVLLDTLDEETEAQREQPHFLFVNVMEAHEAVRRPAVIRPKYADMFDGPNARYLQAIRQLSADVDRFVRTLADRPGWGRTLFVVVSDHGEGLDSHPDVPGTRWHGKVLYASQMIVPWILYDAAGDLPRGKVVERPVRLLDLMPTVLDVAGIEGPTDMRGLSLLPLVRSGEEPGLPERFVVETEFRRADKVGLYTTRWKYIENRDGHRGTAPRELQAVGTMGNGRATDVGAEHPELLERFREQLASWEEAHPRVPPTFRDEKLPADELEQLRALGYAQ